MAGLGGYNGGYNNGRNPQNPYQYGQGYQGYGPPSPYNQYNGYRYLPNPQNINPSGQGYQGYGPPSPYLANNQYNGSRYSSNPQYGYPQYGYPQYNQNRINVVSQPRNVVSQPQNVVSQPRNVVSQPQNGVQTNNAQPALREIQYTQRGYNEYLLSLARADWERYLRNTYQLKREVLSPHVIYGLSKDLAIAGAKHSDTLALNCLGIKREAFYDEHGNISNKTIKELRRLCVDLERCVDKLRRNCIIARTIDRDSLPPDKKQTNLRDLPHEGLEKYDEKSLRKQFEKIRDRLKAMMDRSAWQAFTDIFSRKRFNHDDGLGALLYQAEEMFNGYMETLVERGVAAHTNGGAIERGEDYRPYIDDAIADSKSLKILKEGLRGIKDLIDTVYLPSARADYFVQSEKAIVSYCEQMLELNRNAALGVPENEVNLLLRQYERQLKALGD